MYVSCIYSSCFVNAGNSEGNGELADGEFAVIVGGETLEVDEPMELEAGITYSISLESIGQGPGAISFRGHLLRLNEGDEGISTVNSFLVSDPSSQIAGACILQDQVGGLSHTDSDEKMQAQGQIRMLEADTNVVLEVWVVVRNCGPDSPLMPAPNTVESCDPAESMHYNSQYTLNFVAQQEASNSSIPSQMPSAAPSSAPSLSPTTMMPSDMPSSSPTSSPSTELPTLSPTVTVTGAPSLSYAPSTSTPTNSSQPAEMLSSLAPTVSPSPTVVPTSPAPSGTYACCSKSSAPDQSDCFVGRTYSPSFLPLRFVLFVFTQFLQHQPLKQRHPQSRNSLQPLLLQLRPLQQAQNLQRWPLRRPP